MCLSFGRRTLISFFSHAECGHGKAVAPFWLLMWDARSQKAPQTQRHCKKQKLFAVPWSVLTISSGLFLIIMRKCVNIIPLFLAYNYQIVVDGPGITFSDHLELRFLHLSNIWWLNHIQLSINFRKNYHTWTFFFFFQFQN